MSFRVASPVDNFASISTLPEVKKEGEKCGIHIYYLPALPASIYGKRQTAVIDGAAVARDVAYEAARHADFILIPTKTAVFDTMSMTHTLDVVRQLDRAFAVVLTFVPPQGQETGDAMKAVEELSAAVCPVTIGNRKAFFRAQATGQAVQEFEPHGPAAAEIKRLYEYTAIRLYGKEVV